jgi:hypothetical protein
MYETPAVRTFKDNLIKNAAENPEFKEKLINNPKEVVEKRLNYKLPENFEIAVHEDTPMKLNIVLPLDSAELSEVELAAVSGGGCYTHCDIIF